LHPELSGDALRDQVRASLFAFYMPSRFSSDATSEAAATIAEEASATFMVLPIEEAFERELAAARAMMGEGGPPLTALTEQNIQARLRGTRMWNWANTSHALFLQTGNMSEKALGYTTVGGDLEGAFSVIANLPKTLVIALIDRLYEQTGYEGIRRTLATTAGPELSANQSGEAELMPFEILDACLYLYGAEKLAEDEVAAALPSLFPDRDRADLTAYADLQVGAVSARHPSRLARSRSRESPSVARRSTHRMDRRMTGKNSLATVMRIRCSCSERANLSGETWQSPSH